MSTASPSPSRLSPSSKPSTTSGVDCPSLIYLEGFSQACLSVFPAHFVKIPRPRTVIPVQKPQDSGLLGGPPQALSWRPCPEGTTDSPTLHAALVLTGGAKCQCLANRPLLFPGPLPPSRPNDAVGGPPLASGEDQPTTTLPNPGPRAGLRGPCPFRHPGEPPQETGAVKQRFLFENRVLFCS